MMNLDISYLTEYGLPIANILLLGASALALVRIQRLLRSEKLYSKISAAASAAQRPALEQALVHVSGRMRELQERIDALAKLEKVLAEPSARSAPMERATVLARNGASVDELARSCGLSIGEASLMRRLHQPGTTE